MEIFYNYSDDNRAYYYNSEYIYLYEQEGGLQQPQIDDKEVQSTNDRHFSDNYCIKIIQLLRIYIKYFICTYSILHFKVKKLITTNLF